MLLRLPKTIEADPRVAKLLENMAVRGRPLWSGGMIKVPRAQLDDGLRRVLQTILSAGRIVRSLEKAELKLASEAHGQQIVDRRSGVPRGTRISRLLILTSDGAERFYRRVESLLKRHEQRVLAIRIDTDAETLGNTLFGPGHAARLILIEHKLAVGDVLLALADQWKENESGVI